MTYRFLKSASVCISFLFISTLPAVALDRVMGHGGPVKDVVVSPNDQLLASVSFDYSVVHGTHNHFRRATVYWVMMRL